MKLSDAQIRALRAKPLSSSLLRYFRAVQYFVQLQGYGPTLRQLGDYLGGSKPYSTSAVSEALTKLQAVGLITWERMSSRTLRVVGGVPGDPQVERPRPRLVLASEPVRCARCGVEHFLSPIEHIRHCQGASMETRVSIDEPQSLFPERFTREQMEVVAGKPLDYGDDWKGE